MLKTDCGKEGDAPGRKGVFATSQPRCVILRGNDDRGLQASRGGFSSHREDLMHNYPQAQLQLHQT